MTNIPQDVVSKVSGYQPQIWQTVSMIVSETVGQAVNFTDPATAVATTSDLYGEMAAPKLIVQFAFSHCPENSQVFLISQETISELASIVRGETVSDIDDNLIADLRPALEAIVQGVCLAAGNIRNEPVVASGLSIRLQIFSFPPNMQKADELVRTNISLSGDDPIGSFIWLMDSETAHVVTGMTMQEDAAEAPFERSTNSTSSFQGIHPTLDDDPAALEILMDIPLEISVELGRVKMLVKDVIDLGSGSIVEIDKAAGEPVDVLVNGRLVARGEVVVIEDNFGVRITEILSPAERMARLNEAA